MRQYRFYTDIASTNGREADVRKGRRRSVAAAKKLFFGFFFGFLGFHSF
eukprot:SAG31_NODE_13239_length_883_cov_1.030612_1_plen_48_part_10